MLLCGDRHHFLNVSSDEDPIKMIKSSQFEEMLPPLVSLLHLRLLHTFTVHRDEGVEDLKGVEHLVGGTWVDNLEPTNELDRLRLNLLDFA